MVQVNKTKDAGHGGVKNYLINMYEGEDSNSQELHIQRLRDQATYSTLRQGEHIISLSMDKTFPDRRKMIVEEFCRVSQVNPFERFLLHCH